MTERDFNILIFIPFLKGEQFCINIVILICFLNMHFSFLSQVLSWYEIYTLMN